jgi:tryptophan-rich sensory protein
MKFNWKKAAKLILSIIACHLAGAIGSIFTAPAITNWYITLQKPWFTPPNWVFGPVWLTLYTLMGIALYLVLEKGWKKEKVKIATGIFASQLVLNAAWSIIFFGMKQIFWGFVTIAILWFLIIATIYSFYKISKKAAALLLPYIIWVTIASALNYYVWLLN